MAWYGVDETWELCCNKGCLTKYQKHEVGMPDGRKKDIWLCPGCKHQDVHILGRYVNLRERVDSVGSISSNLESLRKNLKEASMSTNLTAQSNEVRLRALEKRLRRIEELITLKKPMVKKISKKRKKGLIRTITSKVKSVIRRLI
jgi:hypothetical protein